MNLKSISRQWFWLSSANKLLESAKLAAWFCACASLSPSIVAFTLTTSLVRFTLAAGLDAGANPTAPSSSEEGGYQEGVHSCSDRLTVSWIDRTPYITRNKRDDMFYGILVYFLDDGITHCCAGRSPFVSSGRQDGQVGGARDTRGVSWNSSVQYLEMSGHGPRSDAAQFVLPVTRTIRLASLMPETTSRRFLPVAESIGIMYLVKNGVDTPAPDILLRTVFIDGWPFFALFVLVAAYGAIAMWILDSKYNKQEFPIECLAGIWEGFWWSLVTMTTVGYGDRSPKSAGARIFAMLHIVFGIIIVSLFTAAITAMLRDNEGTASIQGKLLAVLKDSPEYVYATSHRSPVVLFDDIGTMLDQLQTNDTIDGALLESNQWTVYSTMTVTDHDSLPKIMAEYTDSVYYGILVRNIEESLWTCLADFLADNTGYGPRHMTLITNHLLKVKKKQGRRTEEVIGKVLPAGPVVTSYTIYAAVVWVVLVAALYTIQRAYPHICKRYANNRGTCSSLKIRSESRRGPSRYRSPCKSSAV